MHSQTVTWQKRTLHLSVTKLGVEKCIILCVCVCVIDFQKGMCNLSGPVTTFERVSISTIIGALVRKEKKS